MSVLVKDTAWFERRKKRRTVASSGTVKRDAPGIEYAIIDPRQGGRQHTVHSIDGEQVRLVNRTGFTDDRDIAMAARAKGLQVVPREKSVPSGKLFFSMSDMPGYDAIDWHRETDGRTESKVDGAGAGPTES